MGVRKLFMVGKKREEEKFILGEVNLNQDMF